MSDWKRSNKVFVASTYNGVPCWIDLRDKDTGALIRLSVVTKKERDFVRAVATKMLSACDAAEGKR